MQGGDGPSEAMSQDHDHDHGRGPGSSSGEPVEMSARNGDNAPQKRTVCDHCRRRRIRCDGEFPCAQCSNSMLTCKRDHVPKKRGPKKGHGRVINELRAREYVAQLPLPGDLTSPIDLDFGLLSDMPMSLSASASPGSTPPAFTWANTSHGGAAGPPAPEPTSMYTSDEYQPRTRSYLALIPQLVELYYEHIYPIMPLLYMPAVRATVTAAGPALAPADRNFVYALCALTALHMSGKSIAVAVPEPWEVVGRFFLDECIGARQAYDFVDDLSLASVISSFYLSTSFFEIDQSRKSWYYLREALTTALDLGLHDDSTYVGLTPEETLCRQRVFWILFVTERSFAILRNKPITFKKTPSLPTTKHSYESPDIHTGFLQLVSSYTPLDESFVTAWNEGSDPRVSASTFLALQTILARPPAFVTRRRYSPPLEACSEPTDIQKADLLITQQWLRLIVWQSSMRQNLLSWSTAATSPGGSSSGSNSSSGENNTDSMCFSFPLAVARDTAAILASLPPTAVEVHGMGIMEKIFEIGTWFVNVLGSCEAAGVAPPGSGMPLAAGDLAVLGTGRIGAAVDPIEFFVQTLSAMPNSRLRYAERLLAAAAETPGSMRLALSPSISSLDAGWNGEGPGSIIGEVKDEIDDGARVVELGDVAVGVGEPMMGYDGLDFGALEDGPASAGLYSAGSIVPEVVGWVAGEDGGYFDGAGLGGAEMLGLGEGFMDVKDLDLRGKGNSGQQGFGHHGNSFGELGEQEDRKPYPGGLLRGSLLGT